MKASGEDDVCPITNLPRYRCDHCIGTDAPALARAVRRRGAVTARFEGPCAYCDGRIHLGQEIRRVPGTNDWAHVGHDLDA